MWVCECMVICVCECVGAWVCGCIRCMTVWGYGYGGMGGSMGMWVSRLEMEG